MKKLQAKLVLNLLRLLLVFVEQFLRKDKSDGTKQEQSCSGDQQTLTLPITRFCRTIP